MNGGECTASRCPTTGALLLSTPPSVLSPSCLVGLRRSLARIQRSAVIGALLREVKRHLHRIPIVPALSQRHQKAPPSKAAPKTFSRILKTVPGEKPSTLVIHRSRRKEPLQREAWRNLGDFLRDGCPLHLALGRRVSPPQLRDLLAARPTSPEFFLPLDRHTAFDLNSFLVYVGIRLTDPPPTLSDRAATYRLILLPGAAALQKLSTIVRHRRAAFTVVGHAASRPPGLEGLSLCFRSFPSEINHAGLPWQGSKQSWPSDAGP